MRIFILSSGEYGSKIVNGLATHGFAPNIVGIHEFPSKDETPDFIEDVTEYVPDNIPEADLIIAVGMHGDINMVIPEVVKRSKAKSAIAAIYHPQQIPLGLQNEIKSELDDDITIVFPKPFCSLTPMGDEFIDKFTKVFGKPKLTIETNSATEEVDLDSTITSVEVLRGAPCGNTWFVAEEILGLPAREAEFEANRKHHNFPCSASMATDKQSGDTILHLASYKIKEAVKRALGFTCRFVMVDPETCEGLEFCDNICLNICPNVQMGINTIHHGEDGKALIDPATCGVCELCIPECPYGVIEFYEEKIPVKKEE